MEKEELIEYLKKMQDYVASLNKVLTERLRIMEQQKNAVKSKDKQ